MVGKDQTQSNYALLHEMRDFIDFIVAEMPGLMSRWQAHRAAGQARTGPPPRHHRARRHPLSWLTKIALRNRSIVGLAVLAVLVFGAFAITGLKQELIPDLTFPYLTVFTVAPGSSPKDVERTITTPLEQAVKATSGVKAFDSFSNDGVSIITIEYEFGTDMQEKEAEVQQAISGVQAMLPATAQAPAVAALNFNSMPVVQLAVSSDLPPEQLAALLGTRVVPRLQGIDGVQAVTLSGVQQMQLEIRLDPEKVAALGVDPTQIATAVTQANVTTGAGTVTSGSLVYPVTVSASAQTEKAIEDLVLPSAAAVSAATSAAASASAASAPQGPPRRRPRPAEPVRLGDVADVKIGPAPLTAITRTNGESSIGISVSKASSGNTVDIANAIAEELPAISEDLGGQATVTTVVDQSVFVKDSISSLLREGLIGAAFAVIVIWAFLRSWRSTVIAGLSIPLSIIGALIILWSRGNSLNMLTLGGLTIAIGRVIDDSIVVIENIHRHLQEGDSIRSAAFTGTREVAGAITASTLTTVAVFLPLGFVSGLASEFFRPFALTVTFALLASLIVALMVVPVVATWMLSKRQVGHRDEKELTHLQNAYLPALKWALNHKILTLVAAFAVFAGTMMLSPLLKTNLFDSSGQNTVSITQTMPAGTSLDATMAAANKVEAVLGETEGIEVYQVTGGSTGSLFGAGGGVNASSNLATFAVTTDPDADKDAIMDELRAGVAELRERRHHHGDRRRRVHGRRHVAARGARVGRRPGGAQGGQRRRARRDEDRRWPRRRDLQPQRGAAVGDHRGRPGQGGGGRRHAVDAEPVPHADPERLPARHGADRPGHAARAGHGRRHRRAAAAGRRGQGARGDPRGRHLRHGPARTRSPRWRRSRRRCR